MRTMRLFGVVFFVVMPASALALTVPFVGSPFAHMSVFFEESSSLPVAGQMAAAANPGVNDICYDGAVAEFNDRPIETYSEGMNFKACKDKRITKADCNDLGKKALVGFVTYTVGSDAVIKINRCDPQPKTAPVSSVSPSINKTALDGINVTDTGDQARMASMLQDQFGISDSKALETVQSDPQKAYDLLNDIASGNGSSPEAQQIAKDFNLDPSVLNSGAGQIVPDTADTPTNTEHPAASDKTTRCGFDGVAGLIMNPESGCGSSTGNGNFHGPLQYSCSTWATYANACGRSDVAGCSNADNAQTAAEITNCYYDTEMTPKYGDRCAALGVSNNSCMYAIHAFGEPGFQKMLAAAEADPSASATAWCGGSACSNKPMLNCGDGTVKGAFLGMDGLLSSGWGACNGGTISAPTTYAGNLGTITPSDRTEKLPTASGTYDNSLTDFNNGSLFGNTQPHVVYVSQPSISSGGLGGLGGMNLGSMLGNLFGSSANTKPAATLMLVLTPQGQIVRGNPIGVQWTSSNVSSCTLTKDSFLLSQNNSGAQWVLTATSTPAGTSVAFQFVCRGTDGKSYQQNASITLQ